MDSIGMLYSLGYLRNELQTANQTLEALRQRLQQAEEREAALREALEEIKSISGKHNEYIHCIAFKALSTPSQPSRYREMEAVVEAARKYRNDCRCLECPCGVKICPGKEVEDALTAYDKAGEGAGK